MDRQAIEALYRQHGHSVLRRARRILGTEDEAREILHELFAGLMSRPDQFAGKSSITTWMYSVTTHMCLNRIRNQRNRMRILEENVRPGLAGSTSGGAEDLVAVHQLLRQVPEDQARAAIHYYLDEMTHDEIAGVLGCSRRHVGNLLARLEENLRTQEAAHARA